MAWSAKPGPYLFSVVPVHPVVIGSMDIYLKVDVMPEEIVDPQVAVDLLGLVDIRLHIREEYTPVELHVVKGAVSLAPGIRISPPEEETVLQNAEILLFKFSHLHLGDELMLEVVIGRLYPEAGIILPGEEAVEVVFGVVDRTQSEILVGLILEEKFHADVVPRYHQVLQGIPIHVVVAPGLNKVLKDRA
jgi:hypothetical protein